jgi:hypothetical protein
MHKPFDQFGKSLAGVLLEQYARVELEHEVQHAAQSVDIAFEPDGRVPEAPLGGWLERIAVAGPGVIECFSHTVRPDEVRSCIYKRDGLYLARLQRARKDRLPRPALPHLWITTAGRPRDLLHAYEAEPLAGWPPGFWSLRRGDALRVVVLSELPQEPDTLALRLMGRGATLRQALLECAALPPGHPLQRRLQPLLVAFRPHILQDPYLRRESHMNVLEEVQAMYERWERETIDRGRKEGQRQGQRQGRKQGEAMALLRLLGRRFGALPEAVTARVTLASTAEIERWLDRVLDASSLDEVFAD